MLHHHDGIGAARKGSSGHDFERLARLNLARERFTGANFADHEQVPGQIRGPHGKTIAHRARERGIVAVRCYRFGEYPAGRLGKTDKLNFWLGLGRAADSPGHTGGPVRR